MRPLRHTLTFVLFVIAGGSSLARADDMAVVSVHPPRHSMNAPAGTSIAVTFDRAVLPASVTPASFSAFGRNSGLVTGTLGLSNGNQTVTLTPSSLLAAGEVVTVTLSHDLQAADGSPLRAAGYCYQFSVRVRPAAMNFAELDVMSNRTPGRGNTRIYGALAADLNEDHFVDLATVNEDSNDVRVFLNAADGSGLYDPWLEPPTPISHEASPNDGGDFNLDGFVDMAIAASSDDDVWILLGNGDGTFQTQQIPVPSEPHGVAALDYDGDGDTDVAVCSRAAGVVTLLTNNGAGVFSLAASFDSGGSGEYGLVAADMNEDGILDLVVGARDSQEVVVLRGNGNGTFTNIEEQGCGGSVWVAIAGDINGDGHLDVVTANAFSFNAGILMGDGTGNLAPVVTQSMVGHTVSADLGDFDGDGDLDLSLSSFSGGLWRLFTNNGLGSFTFLQDFFADSNPSCSIILDFDNDRDLDLALTDEIADLVTLQKNSGTAPLGDFNGDLDVDAGDAAAFEGCFTGPSGGPLAPACYHGDFDEDDDVDCTDWAGFNAAWTAPGDPPPLAQCSMFCDEDTDCDDVDPCTLDRCLATLCAFDPVVYGDVNADAGVDLLDILCVLDAFSGVFAHCSLADADITPCTPDGVVDLADIFAVLDAFQGIAACGCP